MEEGILRSGAACAPYRCLLGVGLMRRRRTLVLVCVGGTLAVCAAVAVLIAPAAAEETIRPRYSASGYDVTPLTDEQLAPLVAKLDEETYRVTQKAGTEEPFCGDLLNVHVEGTYVCVVCGLPLFSSEHKFVSGTGWPSFYTEVDPQQVVTIKDGSGGVRGYEIQCGRCGSHLGHRMVDGPPPTGLRYCVNSVSLRFYAADQPLPPESQPVQVDTAYFAGGCFWGIEHYFDQGPGVLEAVSGYMQGDVENPSYGQVCMENTHHAETVKVVFDPARISYRRLLQAFFDMHDPTQLNRQGADLGNQYRSGIWFVNEAQRSEAEKFIAELEASGRYKSPIVTQVEAAKVFWPAEVGHQDFVVKNGGTCDVADPWN